MRRKRKCNFESIEDQYNFGRYTGLSLADVLDINPSYLEWCVKHCTGVIFILKDKVIDEIKTAYPKFIMDALFESRMNWNRCLDYDENSEDIEYYEDVDEYDLSNEDVSTYDRYAGSWAQDVAGYSDDDIDTIFDGDPSAYWNID